MLDHEHGVAEVPKARERSEKPTVVTLVETNRRLVEHVQHAGQLRPDLRGQPDPLSFAARQRRRAAAKREIADADVGKKPEPIANLPHDAPGDQVLSLGKLHHFEDRQHVGDAADSRTRIRGGP